MLLNLEKSSTSLRNCKVCRISCRLSFIVYVATTGCFCNFCVTTSTFLIQYKCRISSTHHLIIKSDAREGFLVIREALLLTVRTVDVRYVHHQINHVTTHLIGLK